jgi:hypothetical protein
MPAERKQPYKIPFPKYRDPPAPESLDIVTECRVRSVCYRVRDMSHLSLQRKILRRKVKLFLYLINSSPLHEDVWRSGGIASPLTSALDGRYLSATRRCRFTPGERPHGTYWRVRSGRCEVEKNLLLLPGRGHTVA